MYMQKTNIPLKCHICHTCKSVHVQMWANCQYICLMWLNAMNNMAKITGTYTFTLFAYAPLTTMSATLHIYVSLYCYFSLHTNSNNTAYISKQNILQLLIQFNSMHLYSAFRIWLFCRFSNVTLQFSSLGHFPYCVIPFFLRGNHPLPDQLPGEHTGSPSHMRQYLSSLGLSNAALIHALTHGS